MDDYTQECCRTNELEIWQSVNVTDFEKVKLHGFSYPEMALCKCPR